ncbi:tRNA 2-thiocytidine(32) synthetase TtcA [Parvularcula maris]|uniref:tRNA-cytidine(32) 2-sulfurtransferase n=1 Tax=Parvularcula maris TaxID=2965077 RepID=A0A9X2LAD1_9PROT|nr:tRNA 2-thiocytidine(32) synthetase TtcA [Parvularcula maris]MCQ8185844.1 tRNA 2-thiocytidine(32) synthetase TtcA [Parvularcula maris]
MADGAPLIPAFSNGLKVYEHAPASVAFKKLRKRILRQTQEVITDFHLDGPREDGSSQRWLVCLSGGKDSYGLLAALLDLKWQGFLKADLLACNLDQGQPGFPKNVLPDYLGGLGIAHRIVTQDTYSVVTEKVPEGKTYCSLCSRMRRGVLYRVAREEGCDAIVLGHHRDDALETFMMNLMHGGRLAAMPPKLVNDEGDVHVLRPLITTAEKDLAKFAELCAFPIIPCTLCGSQDGLQRVLIKEMLDRWEEKKPGQREVMFRALQNVRPSHLVDKGLFDFKQL